MIRYIHCLDDVVWDLSVSRQIARDNPGTSTYTEPGSAVLFTTFARALGSSWACGFTEQGDESTYLSLMPHRASRLAIRC